MELLDYLLDAYRRGSNLVAPNQEDMKLRQLVAPTMFGSMPVIGDLLSGIDMVDSARKGEYGEAALNGIGLLPFVPAMGGWTVHKLSGGTKVIENPTRDQAYNIAKSGELRAIRDKETGKLYVWDAYDATHKPVAEELGLNFDKIRDQTSRFPEDYGTLNLSQKSIKGYPDKIFSGD